MSISSNVLLSSAFSLGSSLGTAALVMFCLGLGQMAFRVMVHHS